MIIFMFNTQSNVILIEYLYIIKILLDITDCNTTFLQNFYDHKCQNILNNVTLQCLKLVVTFKIVVGCQFVIVIDIDKKEGENRWLTWNCNGNSGLQFRYAMYIFVFPIYVYNLNLSLTTKGSANSLFILFLLTIVLDSYHLKDLISVRYSWRIFFYIFIVLF